SNPVMNHFLTMQLVDIVKKHERMYQDQFDLWSFRLFKTLQEFDQEFTIKLFGYASTDEYYRAADFSDKVHQVAVPTFCIQSGDDMLAPAADLPLEQVVKSGNVAMLVTERGG